ncbi:MAG: hypothetical protein KDD44_10510, partial [Bdellovibrionales bacterium]|nr:hypothetical protein [Bdellovibrionales bacterium]
MSIFPQCGFSPASSPGLLGIGITLMSLSRLLNPTAGLYEKLDTFLSRALYEPNFLKKRSPEKRNEWANLPCLLLGMFLAPVTFLGAEFPWLALVQFLLCLKVITSSGMLSWLPLANYTASTFLLFLMMAPAEPGMWPAVAIIYFLFAGSSAYLSSVKRVTAFTPIILFAAAFLLASMPGAIFGALAWCCCGLLFLQGYHGQSEARQILRWQKLRVDDVRSCSKISLDKLNDMLDRKQGVVYTGEVWFFEKPDFYVSYVISREISTMSDRERECLRIVKTLQESNGLEYWEGKRIEFGLIYADGKGKPEAVDYRVWTEWVNPKNPNHKIKGFTGGEPETPESVLRHLVNYKGTTSEGAVNLCLTYLEQYRNEHPEDPIISQLE